MAPRQTYSREKHYRKSDKKAHGEENRRSVSESRTRRSGKHSGRKLAGSKISISSNSSSCSNKDKVNDNNSIGSPSANEAPAVGDAAPTMTAAAAAPSTPGASANASRADTASTRGGPPPTGPGTKGGSIGGSISGPANSLGGPGGSGGGSHGSGQMGSKHVLELFLVLKDYMNKCDLTSYGPKPVPLPNQWTNMITYDRKTFGALANKVLADMRATFKAEDRMVSVTSPLYVFGDIHGNFHDLRYYERELWSQGPGKTARVSFVFLGDLVDRGHHSLEVVFYLFCCKLMSRRNTFVLLRGNHELRAIQQAFTFHRECIEKLGPSLGAQIWANINKCFDAMPVAALIDQHIFCCHGGIPMSSQSIKDINSIPCPLPDPENQSPIAWELMWNDPLTNSVFGEMAELLRLQSGSRAFTALKGFLPNNKRGTAYYFSESAALKFMEHNGLSHVIRAHECLPTGYTLHTNQKLITVFSSSKYCGGNNDAACVLVEYDDVRVIRLDIGEKNAIPTPNQQ